MRLSMSQSGIVLLTAALLCGCAKDGGDSAGNGNGTHVIRIEPGPKAAEDAQEALILAEPGDVIEFAEGTFEFTGTLSLYDTEGVTIRGQGIEKTTLSFKGMGQGTGGEGLKITADKFTIEDLTVADTPGDAIKVEGADGVVFRRVRTWWTGGPDPENGAYGIYPVLSKNILIEYCIAECASDAGIYVGQSEDAILRHNKATRNVAGIEIENTVRADVYDNVATNNTGGMLVFSLPGLVLKNGSHCRVFNNHIYENNHDNFAKAGNIVADVPPGTGLMIMANDHVEVFDNDIHDNQTANCSIISYIATQRPYDDPEYDPYPEAIHIHDNVFAGGGDNPSGAIGDLVAPLVGGQMPDILYDGIVNTEKLVDGTLPAELRLYIHDNGDADFANIHLGALLTEEQPPSLSLDLEAHAGQLPPLPEVVVAGVD